MGEPLTVEQAAQELGYHPNHVYRLLKQRRIRAQRFAGVWMIDRQEVERIKALQGPGGRLPRSEPEQ
jgi:excisionase family DNA binding protein